MTEEIKEIDLLKQRADLMGIKYSPNIGLEKLKEKVNEAIEDSIEQLPKEDFPIEETLIQKQNRLRKECSRLVRIRLTCMNPEKKSWQGEYFTAANSIISPMTKYVPFNAEDGWHVPQILLNVIREREYVHHYTVKDSKGQPVNKRKMAKEFAIEYLDPLTTEELKELARRQAMTKSIED